MKKIFITTAIIIVGFIALILFSTRGSKNPLTPFKFNPTPTLVVGLRPQGNNTKAHPVILNVSPTSDSSDISLTTHITLTFDRPINLEDFLFWIGPDITYSQSITNNKLIIIPSQPLASDTQYIYLVRYADGSFSNTFSFSTVGAGIVKTSQYDNFSEVAKSFDKKYNPDIFLSNYMPESAATFYANSAYVETPTEHFYFEVTVKTPQGKDDFLNWVKSLGLTDDQIKTLDIHYKDDTAGSAPDNPVKF